VRQALSVTHALEYMPNHRNISDGSSMTVFKEIDASVTKIQSRNGNIDGLRFVAAIGVIALHVGPFPELSDLSADIIRSSFRWCVPFFFMLTGYYLLGSTQSLSKTLLIDWLYHFAHLLSHPSFFFRFF
ncbi:MAG: acyltransferase family protein, partial [Gammaproteobacteria bacterium]|nr:acyltransferase family protein [Gammaproteobacteria bacterium]